MQDSAWQCVSGCCMSADGVLCRKLCHKSERTCTRGTPRWWQCSCLRLQEIDRREENYKETQRGGVSERERQRSAFLLCLAWWISRGGAIWHLSPNQPGTITSRGRTGNLLGELCTAPSEIGKRLKIISVTGPVFVAPSKPLNGKLWSRCRYFFVNCTGTAHKL